MASQVDIWFTDGKCSIYETQERKLSTKIGDFYFKEETLGIKAFTELQSIGTQTDMVISIPYNKLIDKAKAVVIDEIVYNIALIQPKDTFPKSLRLTLSRSPFKWSSIAN